MLLNAILQRRETMENEPLLDDDTLDALELIDY